MKNSEQPAFPLSLIKTKTGIVDSADIDGGGLTKREYFAAMAMQGLCHNYFNTNLSRQSEAVGANIDVAIAVAAVSVADELLTQLEK